DDRERLPVDRDLARPGECRPPVLSGPRKRTPVFGHLRRLQDAQDRAPQDALHEHILVENQLLARRGTEALKQPSRALRPLAPAEWADDRLHVDNAPNPVAVMVCPIEAEC